MKDNISNHRKNLLKYLGINDHGLQPTLKYCVNETVFALCIIVHGYSQETGTEPDMNDAHEVQLESEL